MTSGTGRNGAAPRPTLVIGPAWVGDLVMAQALFRVLAGRDPATPIDVVAPAWAAPLLARMPEVRHWIDSPFPRRKLSLGARWRAGRALRGRYGVAYVLPNSWKSALLPFFAGIPRRIGYKGEWRGGLINDVRFLAVARKRRTAEAYAALAGASLPPPPPRLSVDGASQAALLGRFGLSAGGFVALMPGAAFGPAKQWPVAHYAALAEALLARGLAVAVLGAAADAPAGAAIAAAVPAAMDLCGRTALVDTVDLLAAARAAVTNDSGLMHVAAAVNTPVVALYGPTSPRDTPPLTDRAAILTRALPCAPCHKRLCPLGHHACLQDLAPATVLAAVDRVTGRTA